MAVAIKHFGAPRVVVLLLLVVPAAVITIPTLTLCVNAPLVPMIDRVNEPNDDPGDALTVRVDVAVEPEGGVMGPGILTVTPDGAEPIHELLRATAEVKPFKEPTVMVEVPLAP